LGSALHAGNPGGHDHAPRHLPEPDGKIKFVENQGQWDAHIRYAADIPGGRVFVEADRLTFHLADLSGLHDAYFHAEGHRDHRPIEIRGHAFQLVFPQAQAAARIVPAAAYPEYHNYFIGDDPSRWRGGVPLYGQLRYEELWPGIDLVLYGREGSIKYDLVVHPGHDTRAIALQYAGVDAPQVQPDGRLRVPTALGPLYDAAPVAFQGQSAAVVPSRFECEGQTLRFGFAQPGGVWSSYQNTGDEDFIIDPSLVFGSYTGSTADNFGFTATYDTAGNLYGGGIVFGVGYPTTLGAFQTTYGGGGASHFGNGFDISISKFNPTGTALVYSTYLGGSLNEQPHSLITNDDGELMVYGRSNSLNYPTTAGASQTVNGGNSDIIVTKFNAAGSALIGSTYLGGSGEDGLNVHVNFFRSGLYHNYGDDARGEIMIDASGNIYIASCTQSANFPTSPGAFQAAFGGGIQDGCVVKFNSNLTTRIWSTYLGGNAHDAAYSVKVDGSGSAYVTGGTESANFPTTAGTVSPASNGSTEGFITRLNPAGSALVASTFVGTSSYDQCFFLELDASGSVYVFGQTEGAFPVSPGVYSNPGSGQFIAKYNGLLTTTAFSTVFGTGSGSIDISPTAFLVDICGFIYVSGWGGSVNFSGTTNGLPTTANAFQSVTDGSDIYLLVLQPDAAGLEYATFYGGGTSSEHVDGGTSRFDKELVVYQAVCAGCGGNDDFPTTPGAVSATNNSFNCNLGVFKFAFDAQFVEADYTAIALDSCAPFPVVFTNASTGALSYFWDFGDGSTSTLFSPSHTFVNPGTYTVTLIAIDSNSCNVADTAIATVTVYANPIIIINQSDTACAGDAVQLLASGGQFYSWSPAATLSNPNIAAPIAHPTVNTTYSVIVSDTNGCVDTATVDIYVTFFNADAGPPVAFCEGTGGAQLQAGLINGGLAPYYYIWTCDTTNTFCGLDSVFDDNPVANPTQTTMYYLQVQDSRGCLSELDSALVEVLPNPIADAGPDQYICQAPSPGALLHGTIYGAPGPYTFYWIQSTGLNDSTILNPFARPDTTTIYTLVAVSSNGCTSNPTTVDTTSTVTVHVHPRPIADAGPTIHSCFGDTVMIQGLGYGAGPDYDFEWSPFTGLSDSSINNPHGSPPITTTYTLTVWSNGCPSYGDTMTLWVHTLPTPSAGNIVEICLGDSGQFDAFGAGDSSAYYTYQWTPPLGLNDPTLENPLASPDTTTTYFLEVTSSWGCKSPLDSVLLRVKPTPIAEAGPNLIICDGDSIVLPGSYHYATTDSAPPSQIYYSWTPALTLDDSTLAQPLAFPGSSTVYQLQVFHNTCVTADSLLVTVVPGLGATAASDTSTICGGDSVRLTAIGGGGGASILWTPATGLDDPTSFTPMAAPGDSITYTATLSEGGCIEAIPVQLNVIPRPTAAFIGSDDQGCPPHPVHFLNTSDAATAYVWNFGDGTPVSNFPDPTHTFTTPGTYTVLLTALVQGACADTAAPMTITVGDTAVVDFMSDPAFPAQLSLPSAHFDFTNLTVNGLSYVWDFGDGTQSTLLNPDHSYASPGEYYVRLIARSGSDCPGSVVYGPYVVVLPDLYIPNVFSPNGDGINDLFRPDYTGDQPFSFGVYDRWGHPLYITQNKVAAWDGRTAMGDPVPEGVFFYRVRVADKDYVGELTLLR
jgi:gliding motility-associated-like protein